MSRPRTVGASITFRLPLRLHAEAERLAQEAGMNVSAYICKRVEDGLERGINRAIEMGQPVEGVQAQLGADCLHDHVSRMPTGLWRCQDCGCVSHDRGENWRLP